jgi:hypothetical protein
MIVAVLIAALLASPAMAVTVQLACKGETNAYNKGSFSPSQETVSVTIDFSAGVVTVRNQVGTWTVPMINRANEDMVTLAHRDEGVTMGSINRITGVATFGFAEPGFSLFQGVCERVQNLF